MIFQMSQEIKKNTQGYQSSDPSSVRLTATIQWASGKNSVRHS